MTPAPAAPATRLAVGIPSGRSVTVPISKTMQATVIVGGGPVQATVTMTGPPGPPGVWVQMTQAAYDALPVKDPSTLYVIVG